MSTAPVTASGTAPAPSRAAALAREIPAGRRAGWWGMVLTLLTDVSAFASLLAAYFYLRFVTSDQWPPAGDPLPKLAKASIMTGLLVVSVVPMVVADLGVKRGSRGRLLSGLLLTALLGAGYVVVTGLEWSDELKTSWPTKNAYGSLFYTITGFHVLHIALGVLFLLLLLVATLAGRMARKQHIVVRVFALFWHTSVVVWVLIYASLYLVVRL